jgi:hypothetical protein
MDSIALDRRSRAPEAQAASWPAATPVWPANCATTTPGARARESLLQPLAITSTAGLPAAAQFKAWRERCAPVVEMIEPLGAGPGYRANCTTWKLGPFALSTVLAPAARYRRTRRQIRRDVLDHWAISVARRGTHSMLTEAGDSTARTGVPYIFSFANAFEGQCSGVDWLCLFVPRETFPELGPVIDRCLHLSRESGLAQLLASYLCAASWNGAGRAFAGRPLPVGYGLGLGAQGRHPLLMRCEGGAPSLTGDTGARAGA